MYVGYITCLGS